MSDNDNYFDRYMELKSYFWVPIVISGLTFACMLGMLQFVSVTGDKQYAVAISVLQIIMAVAAFGGFWAIRGAAITKSAEVASETAQKIATERMERFIQQQQGQSQQSPAPTNEQTTLIAATAPSGASRVVSNE